MSLTPFVSFQSQFVTYLLTVPRTHILILIYKTPIKHTPH